MRNMIVGVLALTLGLAGPVWAAKQMYKWVDDKGKVHYGDTIPPEYAKQGNKELTKSGRVVKETAPAATPEQLRAREEAAAKEKVAQEQAVEQQRRDKALLASYTTLGELDLAEKRNLESIDVQIKSHELRIKSVQGRLDGLKKQEERIAGRQKPIPPDLTEDIQRTGDEIAHLRGVIANLGRDKDALRARFAADKKRYMELKGMDEPPAAPKPAAKP